MLLSKMTALKHPLLSSAGVYVSAIQAPFSYGWKIINFFRNITPI